MSKSRWKTAFFVLLSVNIIVIIILTALIFLPVNQTYPSDSDSTKDEILAKLSVQATKNDLDILVNRIIERENKDSQIDYYVIFADEVELYGDFPVFDQTVELKLTFQPEALENGDLILKQNQISIGQLQLPVKFVMNFIKDGYHFPEWVEIRPDDKMIYVHLTEIELPNNLRIHAKTFDLVNDKIDFTLLLKK
jgi:uncharacterized protein YpmS